MGFKNSKFGRSGICLLSTCSFFSLFIPVFISMFDERKLAIESDRINCTNDFVPGPSCKLLEFRVSYQVIRAVSSLLLPFWMNVRQPRFVLVLCPFGVWLLWMEIEWDELDIFMVFLIIFDFFRFCTKRGYCPGFSMRIKKNQKGAARFRVDCRLDCRLDCMVCKWKLMARVFWCVTRPKF